jgi:hypothetical protein
MLHSLVKNEGLGNKLLRLRSPEQIQGTWLKDRGGRYGGCIIFPTIVDDKGKAEEGSFCWHICHNGIFEGRRRLGLWCMLIMIENVIKQVFMVIKGDLRSFSQRNHVISIYSEHPNTFIMPFCIYRAYPRVRSFRIRNLNTVLFTTKIKKCEQEFNAEILENDTLRVLS